VNGRRPAAPRIRDLAARAATYPRRASDVIGRHRGMAAVVATLLLIAAIAGAFVFGSVISSVRSDPRPQIAYSSSWTLADLERHIESGEVAALTTGSDAGTTATTAGPGASGSATPAQTILAAKTTTGQFVKVDLAVTVEEAIAALRSLGYVPQDIRPFIDTRPARTARCTTMLTSPRPPGPLPEERT